MTTRLGAVFLAAALAGGCGSVLHGDDTEPDGGADVDSGANAADAAQVAPNIAFITSDFFDGALSGVQGADAICNTVAGAADLPGTYVAWLSSASSDVRDRIGGASGWVRPDGRPFAASVADIAAGHILYPPSIDELGAAQQRSIWTATTADGSYDGGGDCGDWGTADTATATSGTSFGGMSRFTDNVALPCNAFLSLLCLGVDRAGSIAPPADTGRVAFVSRGRLAGDATTAAFDAMCAAEASDAGLAGNFAAALSVGGQPLSNRFGGATETWVRPDGVRLFEDAAGAAAGAMSAPIEVTADGFHVDDTPWTGAGSWTASGANCDDFTNAALTGLLGRTNLIDGRATTAVTGDCQLSFPVYCYEQ